MTMARKGSEADEVIERYSRRRESGLYSMTRPEVLLSFQERQRQIVSVLRRYLPCPFNEARLLEVGCGSGGNLLELIQLGFEPANLAGSELLSDRVATARHRLPTATKVVEGDATRMDFEPSSFDVVFVSVVFSSLLDSDFQRELADRMWSWVRPGGGVLWYDFTYDNPANNDVRGVSVKRIRELFPRANIEARRLTLAPPISRFVCRVHPIFYHLFNFLPFLRTHVLCWVSKV